MSLDGNTIGAAVQAAIAGALAAHPDPGDPQREALWRGIAGAIAGAVNGEYTQAGAIQQGTGSGAFGELGPGAAGRVLTSHGVGVALTWEPGGGGTVAPLVAPLVALAGAALATALSPAEQLVGSVYFRASDYPVPAGRTKAQLTASILGSVSVAGVVGTVRVRRASDGVLLDTVTINAIATTFAGGIAFDAANATAYLVTACLDTGDRIFLLHHIELAVSFV